VSVQIGFSYKKGNILSWLIRKVSSSTCSHAWLLIDDPFFGVPMVLQASIEGGFVPMPYARFLTSNTVVEVITPIIPLDAALHTAWPDLGTPYDYLGLFGMAWVMLGRLFHRMWNNPLSSSSEMFCSEAVVEAILIPAQYPGVDSLGPDQDVSPQALRTFLSSAKSAHAI
jgi:hypothetical protein